MTDFKIRPSAGSRVLYCTESLNRHKNTGGSVYTRRGTTAHALAEKGLNGCISKADIGMDLEGNGEPVTEEMLNWVLGYIERCKKSIADVGGDAVSYVEKKFTLCGECGGTPDLVILGVNSLTVVDLKTGSGVQVFAEKNDQLLVYALAVMRDFKMKIKDLSKFRIKLIIDQPSLNHYDTWELTAKQILPYKRFVVNAVKNIRAEEYRFWPGEKQCKWCSFAGGCKANTEHHLDKTKNLFKPFAVKEIKESKDPKDPKDPASMNTDRLQEIYKAIPGFTDWIKAVKQEMFNRKMDTPGELPGFKIVESTKHNVWKKGVVDEVKFLLGNADAFAIPKLKTPAQALKIVNKKYRGKLRKLIERPLGEPTLVYASDKRKEWTSIDAKEVFEKELEKGD